MIDAEELEIPEEFREKVCDLLDFVKTYIRLNGQIKTVDMLEELISELE